MSEALAWTTEALQTTGCQANHTKVRIPQAASQERETDGVSPGHHVFHGGQPGVWSLVIGGLQVPQHLPPLLWTHGPGLAHPGNHCRLFRGGRRTQAPLNEICDSMGLLLWAGWGLRPQESSAPVQQNDSNEKNDANTSKQ